MSASFSCILERKVSKRMNPDVIEKMLEHIVGRAIAGDRRAWECTEYQTPKPTQVADLWVYKFPLKFARTGGHSVGNGVLDSELASILKYMQEAGENTKYKPYVWRVSECKPSWGAMDQSLIKEETIISPEDVAKDIDDIVDFEQAKDIEEIEIPEVLISGSDEEIERFPAFNGIFGRARHIRIIGASLKRMQDTKGKKRSHILLHGLPGCAKSHIMLGWMKVLGTGGFVAINANSATKAGIERIFLDRLKQTGCPPVFFVEEIEKSLETVLTVWLSILDDRAEVRKVTHAKQRKVSANVLCISSANDKILFDRLHGGRPGNPGALSSRFTKKLYVPRPDKEIMRRILLRDIALYGGKKLWVEPCLEIAEELGTNDPRIALSLLDGQDRLLDGTYREDIIKVYEMEKEESWVVTETAEDE